MRLSSDTSFIGLRSDGLALREAEVSNLHSVLAVFWHDEAVFGLQVAMLRLVIVEVLHPLGVTSQDQSTTSECRKSQGRSAVESFHLSDVHENLQVLLVT